jgi:putative YjhG/YagF family dehydratase
MLKKQISSFKKIVGSDKEITLTRTKGEGPRGKLSVTEQMLLNEPSGTLFGLTQNSGMGWNPHDAGLDQYLILSTLGGLRADTGEPLALGYHTGHWEIGLLVKQAAETLRNEGVLPFAAYCSDPCDGRTQGTPGMFDSLPYRNDAAITMRRLIRSLPLRKGVMGVATCDKGLPAMMMALVGCSNLPGIIVPGGVTLPAIGGEDTAKIQSIGARFAHKIIDKEYAAEMGCRACGSAGGGCQFLGTAATAQVVAEALGMALPHSALSPSGEPIWLDIAHRSALALLRLKQMDIPVSKIVTQHALENAMMVFAAFGGSTNLLLHIPAIAHAAGLKLPSVDDWIRINKAVPRLVDALPNGPRNHPTVQVFLAGGVPEVMQHLRSMGLLNTDVLTATGETLDNNLNWWHDCKRRRAAHRHLAKKDDIDYKKVIMDADSARNAGLTSTMVFPKGNIASQGAVIKATTLDPSLLDGNRLYKHTGPARVFVSEEDAIKAIKSQSETTIKAGDIIVLIGCGPLGTGMEETYQLTSALTYIPWGKHIPVLTDARFSGVSTGACIGHIGPEALAGGAIGKLRDGDRIEIIIDREQLTGTINFIGTTSEKLTPEAASRVLSSRESHSKLHVNKKLPEDTRLWAALQQASSGIWSGCIYDIDKIIDCIDAGIAARETGVRMPRVNGGENSSENK